MHGVCVCPPQFTQLLRTPFLSHVCWKYCGSTSHFLLQNNTGLYHRHKIGAAKICFGCGTSSLVTRPKRKCIVNELDNLITTLNLETGVIATGFFPGRVKPMT